MKLQSLRNALLIIAFLIMAQSAKSADPQSGIRYLHPIFEQVTVQKEVEFGTALNFEGQNEKLLLDIYAPQGDTASQRAVILWLHGGGFRPGNDKSQSYIVKIANDFAKRGYLCISANYRIRNNPRDDKSGTISDALKDAMAALNWIRDNHETLRIDLNRIIIGGGSAGGMLAVNFCTKDNSASESWNKKGIIGLVNLWGSPDDSYFFSTIDPSDPPTITVHGTADKLVAYENTLQLTKRLNDNKIRNEVVTLEGAEHTPVKYYDDFSKKIAGFLYSLVTKK